jgi:glutamyl-tRNA synthetase
VAKNSAIACRGRLAPSPTGYLHLGHARTFWIAHQRARAAGGILVLRNDDLDTARCRPEFAAAQIEDLRWLGLSWEEGPDLGGPLGPYNQSERRPLYRAAFEQLRAAGLVYPCSCSRKDLQSAASAPHEHADEPLYPGTCRPENLTSHERTARAGLNATSVNWRFRVPDGESVAFTDGALGPQSAVAGHNFGDFLVWRKDGTPSYQLACAVDDATMRITEVVRGADLAMSTFRQLLLFRALGHIAPHYYHCPLVTDEKGVRLAKRHDALSLRTLREQGKKPRELVGDSAL